VHSGALISVYTTRDDGNPFVTKRHSLAQCFAKEIVQLLTFMKRKNLWKWSVNKKENLSIFETISIHSLLGSLDDGILQVRDRVSPHNS
jgi:hypothetical protein